MKIQYVSVGGRLIYRGTYLFVVCLFAIAGLQLLFASLAGAEQRVFAAPLPVTGGEYEIRKSQLVTSANQPFIDDSFRYTETVLDTYSYDQLIQMVCPKPIDNDDGWSVIFRTGGRPFLNFDVIRINGITWTVTQCTPGDSGITPEVITDHYATGKTVNRLWVTHRVTSTNNHPIVLAFTPDGFFNPSGAFSYTLQGAVVRAGFIGEPFGALDYLQHVDELDIYTDTENIRFVYSIHSEAGEGVLELTVRWDDTTHRPILQFRSAHTIRTDEPPATTLLGCVGFNFMRGPTLYGLRPSNTPGGIEAFHDGRSAFLVQPNGSFIRDLLVPPVLTSTVIREDITSGALAGSKLIMDQPQGVANYFSKIPGIHYEHRTDLILKVISSTIPTLTVRKAQTAVDLTSINPEANETTNLFYAAELTPGVVTEYRYDILVEALDFPELYPARQQGMVFVSNRSETFQKLFFQPLDANFLPAGPAVHLTDGVLADVSEPAASQNGRFIIFDADDYGEDTHQRIYLLDLLTGAVRRLTIDPSGNSEDWGASLNVDNSLFSFINNRSGTNNNLRLNIEVVENGLGSGSGNSVLAGVDYADWSHTTNELAYSNYVHTLLNLYDPATMGITNMVTGSSLTSPQLSPAGDRMIYLQNINVRLLYRPALTSTLVLANALNPTWVDEGHLIVQQNISGNQELFLLTLESGELIALTNHVAADIEPVFVPAIGPRINILSPQDGSERTNPVQISGFVASSGIPTVTVNGLTASVEGDQWFIELSLPPGEHPITAQVVDSGTGLTDLEEITIRVVDMELTGPVVGLVNETYVFTATILPLSTIQPITYTWSATDHPAIIQPNGGIQDTQILSWTMNGTKNITVTADNGNFTLTRNYQIDIFEPVHAGFEANPLSGIAPLTVTFTNLSTGDFTDCIWEFGDGTTADSCANQTYTYTDGGVYTATLTISGPGGNDSFTSNITVGFNVFLPILLKPN